MPNKWTFLIKPIAALLKEEVTNDGKGWVDPFAGKHSPAEFTNDLDPKSNAKSHMDALEFLKTIPDESAEGYFHDPPYSITQAKQCYKGIGMDKLDTKPTSMEYWSKCKDEMKRGLKPGRKVICCGWTTMGLGKERGFEMNRILIVPHGGSRNDTLVTVEVKK